MPEPVSHMMKLLRKRRSARRFTGEPIDGPTRELFKEALLRAPTSKNNRPWEFVFVDDKSLLERLATIKPHGAAFLSGAPFCVAILADPDKSDVWVEDCAIAAITLQYVCESMGLGSCWVQVRKRTHADDRSAEEAVREILAIPPHLRVASIVGIGQTANTQPGVPFDTLDMTKIKQNGY